MASMADGHLSSLVLSDGPYRYWLNSTNLCSAQDYNLPDQSQKHTKNYIFGFIGRWGSPVWFGTGRVLLIDFA